MPTLLFTCPKTLMKRGRGQLRQVSQVVLAIDTASQLRVAA